MNAIIQTPTHWSQQTCRHIGHEGQWSTTHLAEQIKLFPAWQISQGENIQLQARFEFNNFEQLQPFVMAVMSIAHQQDHHPDVQFGYKHCQVALNTHSAGGISDNDWIVAALVDEAFTRLKANSQ